MIVTLEDKKKILYKKIQIAALVYVVGLIIIVAGWLYGSNSLDQAVNTKNNAEKDKIIAQSNLLDLENQIKDSKESYALWQNLNKISVKRNGLELDKLRVIITDLAKHYKLSDKVNINLTSPNVESDLYKKKSTVIESSSPLLSLLVLIVM